jgi:hypothetical protein
VLAFNTLPPVCGGGLRGVLKRERERAGLQLGLSSIGDHIGPSFWGVSQIGKTEVLQLWVVYRIPAKKHWRKMTFPSRPSHVKRDLGRIRKAPTFCSVFLFRRQVRLPLPPYTLSLRQPLFLRRNTKSGDAERVSCHSAMKFGHKFADIIEATHPSVSDQVGLPFFKPVFTSLLCGLGKGGAAAKQRRSFWRRPRTERLENTPPPRCTSPQRNHPRGAAAPQPPDPPALASSYHPPPPEQRNKVLSVVKTRHKSHSLVPLVANAHARAHCKRHATHTRTHPPPSPTHALYTSSSCATRR